MEALWHDVVHFRDLPFIVLCLHRNNYYSCLTFNNFQEKSKPWWICTSLLLFFVSVLFSFIVTQLFSVLSPLVFSVVVCECFKKHILETCDGLRPVSLTTLSLKLLRCLKFCFRFCWKTWKKIINDLKKLEKTWNLFAKNEWLPSSII